MPVTVRMADLTDPDDAATVVELTDAYARSETGGGQPLPDAVKDDLVPAMLEHGNVDVLIAEIGGEQILSDREALAQAEADGEQPDAAADGPTPVGICTVVYKFSTFSAAPTMNIHDIAVLPEHRGQGIGRKLLDTAEVVARKRGCARMNLEVLDQNPARRLYERAGYEAKSTYMVKPLTSAGESYASDRS